MTQPERMANTLVVTRLQQAILDIARRLGRQDLSDDERIELVGTSLRLQVQRACIQACLASTSKLHGGNVRIERDGTLLICVGGDITLRVMQISDRVCVRALGFLAQRMLSELGHPSNLTFYTHVPPADIVRPRAAS